MILANPMIKLHSKILVIFVGFLVFALLLPEFTFAALRFGQNINPREEIRQKIEQRREEWQQRWEQVRQEHQQWQEEMQSIRKNRINDSTMTALICSNLEKWVTKIDQVLVQKEAKILEKQTERMERLNEKRENRDQKLEQFRNRWEEKWEEHFGLLEEKASTSEQKQALVDFKEAVKEAIASRQAAVDRAITDFRNGLDDLINERKTAIEDAKIAYIDAYNAAVQKAKEACTNGEDPAKIKEDLKNAIKTAKEKFIQQKKEIERLEVKGLVEIRQKEFKEALDYFKRAMEQARAELKAALETGEND